MLRLYFRFPLACTLLVTVFLLAAASALAVWNGGPYAPGETLDPACGPEDVTCIVSLPPTFATTTVSLPDLFAVTGTFSAAGLDPVHVTLASQPPGRFFASPPGISGAPSFRLIAESDLPDSLHKDLVGTVYGNFVGDSVQAVNATSTHFYASVGHFDTLTVGGRVIGANEFTASTLCALPQGLGTSATDELDFAPEPVILTDQEEVVAEEPILSPDTSAASNSEPSMSEVDDEPLAPIPDNEVPIHESSL